MKNTIKKIENIIEKIIKEINLINYPIEIKYKMNEAKGINDKIDLKRIINNTYNGFNSKQNRLKSNFGFNGI